MRISARTATMAVRLTLQAARLRVLLRRTQLRSSRPLCSPQRASQAPSQGLLQRFLIQAQIGHQLLKFLILFLKLRKPASLGRTSSSVGVLQAVIRCIRHSKLAADLSKGHAWFCPSQLKANRLPVRRLYAVAALFLPRIVSEITHFALRRLVGQAPSGAP